MAHISFFVYLSAFLTLNINKPGYVLASAISSNINPDSPVTHTLVRREFKCQKYADCQVSTTVYHSDKTSVPNAKDIDRETEREIER